MGASSRGCVAPGHTWNLWRDLPRRYARSSCRLERSKDQAEVLPGVVGEAAGNRILGTVPIGPVVIRSDLDGELKERLCAILLSTGVDPHLSATLAWFGLERFAPVTYEHYALEEHALRKCERALGTRL